MEQLEAMAREQIQRFGQQLLEEEVTELVGETRSQRRLVVGDESCLVYGNGHGMPRWLALTCGTIRGATAAEAFSARAHRERGAGAVQAAH